MYVFPGLLKKPTVNERRQKVLKKPAPEDRPDDDAPGKFVTGDPDLKR